MATDDHMTADQYNELMAKRKVSKYRNEKTEVDGVLFDSLAEATRYWDLKQLERAGEIRDLELQPVFPLIVNGVRVANYIADFRYRDTDGRIVIEDVKSDFTRTNRLYRLKAKMVTAQYGLEIREVA